MRLQLYYVHQSKAGGYPCDDHCLGYKSSKICSHTVEAALKNGTITSFIRWHQTLKCQLNLQSCQRVANQPMLARSLSVKAPQRKSPKKVQNILASASEDSFDNRAHLTGSSVCASMSSSVDSSTSLATTVALTQVGVSVQSFGFQSPVVVSQFSHGPPPLIRASIYLLPPHLVILHHLLTLKILLKGLHTVLFKHHQGLILGLVGCSGLVRHRGLSLLFILHCMFPRGK